jgi:hypothetical protein
LRREVTHRDWSQGSAKTVDLLHRYYTTPSLANLNDLPFTQNDLPQNSSEFPAAFAILTPGRFISGFPSFRVCGICRRNHDK